MGRFVLLIPALLAALAGCGREGPAVSGRLEGAASASDRTEVEAAAGAQEARSGAHAELACASCHRSGMADRSVAAVPRSACTASGCHTDAGPAELMVAGVAFPHRGHGQEESVAMGCAGCHSHGSGAEPLSAGRDACGLCHADQLTGERAADCRRCHRVPAHVGIASQGVPVPHEGMPWIEGECVRCHYDVSAPAIAVSPASCAACHRELETLTARSIGRDLHPAHTDVSCHGCHGETGHRIVAMSSAVSLECSDCHLTVHGVEVEPRFPGSGTCSSCHREVHAVQQRLVLGVVPGHPDARPSEKFVGGLTCRSCHVSVGGGSSQETVTGSEVSCSGCHRPEYATVLRWWDEGTAQRARLTEGYLRSAEGLLVGDVPASARASLEESRELLTFVLQGGGPHNLPLTHALLVESLEKAGDAVRVAGGTAPPLPELGRQPRMGLCTYCHYRLNDPWQFGQMSGDFHRDVLRR